MTFDKLKEGDVIFTNCVDVDLCYHVGIVYKKNNRTFVFHNCPENMNKYGGSVVCEPIHNYKKRRELYKVVHTNIKNQRILDVTRKLKYDIWDSMYFNCEDFISEIVQDERESDIRDAYKIAALSFGLLLIL